MLIAITGATGFVGRHIAAALARRGHSLRALVRSLPRAERAAIPSRDLVLGDLGAGPALARLASGADAIVHLVGIIVEAGPATFSRVHVDGTRRLLEAARDARVPRFVHMSSIGAREEPDATPYHRTKWEAEQLVRTSGLSHVIFRPAIISGPENAPIRALARLHRWSPLVPVFGDGRAAMQPVWIEDVAQAVAVAAENPAITGAFELGGPAVLSYEEFVRAIGRAAGHPRALVHVPLQLARAVAHVFDLLGSAAPLTSDQLQMLVEGSTTPANALESVFGITPLGFEAGLARYIGAAEA